MSKIKVANPVVELDGDEMTRIIWDMIKKKLILPYLDVDLHYYDLSVENRDAQNGGISTSTSPTQRVINPCARAASLTRKPVRFSAEKLRRVAKSSTISTAQIIPSQRTSPTFGCSQNRCASSCNLRPRARTCAIGCTVSSSRRLASAAAHPS